MKVNLSPITEYQDKQCNLFSKYSVYSSLEEYKKRNQTNKDKIISDIYYGKVSEFLVYNYLVFKGKKLASPDLNIYLGNNKSYDADLILDNAKIHVKSHVINGNFPVSWVFQKNDPLLSHPNSDDYLALVVINKGINYMYLKKISEVTFSPPMKESLRTTKMCIYEKDFNLFV